MELVRDGLVFDEINAQVPPIVTAHLESPDGSVDKIVGSRKHTYRFSV